MLFEDWSGIGRVLFMAIATYVSLIVLLQVSGKRTLATMTAFDFIVTVALGSLMANIVFSKDTVLLEGITAMVALIGMQYIISTLTVRSKEFEKLVKAEPALLVHRGQMVTETMKKERITESDIQAIVRQRGLSSYEKAEAVVLEANGSYDVIADTGQDQPFTLK